MLNKTLLFSDEFFILNDDTEIEGTNIKGTYNAMNFAIRLRSDIHKELDGVTPGVYYGKDISDNKSQAFSTLLHENIHWWQHVGSNFGIITSLKYPGLTHRVIDDLKEILKKEGANKSLIKYNKIKNTTEKNEALNRVINNYHDIEIAGLVTLSPKDTEEFTDDPYFLSLGHSYNILWTTSIGTIASCIDPLLEFLPNIRNWENNFLKLRDQKVEGFYYGSPIYIQPIGSKAIFEGQARISQIQYLYFSDKTTYKMSEFISEGMLDGIYGEAILLFLKTLGVSMPESPIDSIIGLFLLLCDISINPTDGFPFDIMHYESFVTSNDPGFRFYMLSIIIRDKYPELKEAIKNYSKKEYVEISKLLCTEMACASPYESSTLINSWIKKHKSIQELLIEESLFNYKLENLPIRVFFSKFLRIQEDKYKYPEFFCWPGLCFSAQEKNQIDLETVQKLFAKHHALFINNIDDELRPVLFEDIDTKRISDTFDKFFEWNCVYDLTRKWIKQAGPFTYNYKWLTKSDSESEVKDWATKSFKFVYGVDPDDFNII